MLRGGGRRFVSWGGAGPTARCTKRDEELLAEAARERERRVPSLSARPSRPTIRRNARARPPRAPSPPQPPERHSQSAFTLGSGRAYGAPAAGEVRGAARRGSARLPSSYCEWARSGDVSAECQQCSD